MPAFAQKPKSTWQPVPAQSTTFGWSHLGQNHDSSLSGYQTVQQTVQPQAEELEVSSIGTHMRFGHDFSGIPVRSPVAGVIQPKLTVNTPGDAYEQEADRVAEQVMRMASPIQRHTTEDQLVQRKTTGDVQGQTVPPIVHEVLRSPGQPLDSATRACMEPRFGRDFGHVRVHYGDKATIAANKVHARAFTLGRDIVFDQREYSPGTSEGRLLLAHELVHVVQQLGARVPIPVQTRDNGTSRADINLVTATKTDLNAAPAQHSPRVVLPAPPMVARGERWDAFWGVGPLDALKAKELADKSLNAARQTGLPGVHNGPADAWRHCYWNCLMTDELGKDQAKFVADNHEKHGDGPAIENLMDSRNNWEGRECGGSNCDPCCQTKLDTGVLDVIEGGKMVPSKTTPRTGGKQSDKYEY
jgi:Domain of unknown function (DUF4157)